MARRACSAAWSGRPLLAGAVASLAAMILALVLLLSSGGSGAPSVLQASALALRPSTQSAPRESSERAGAPHDLRGWHRLPLLGQALWLARRGRPHRHRWRAHGDDRLLLLHQLGRRGGGSGMRSSGGPAARDPHRRATRRAGMECAFRCSAPAAATVVTWRRAGHTCILAGSGVSSRTLLTLANWQAT